MTTGRRNTAAVAAAVLCLTALVGITGCAEDGGKSQGTTGAPETTGPAQVTEMEQLVDAAESAAAAAESAAVEDD